MKRIFLLFLGLGNLAYGQNPLFIPSTLSGNTINLSLQNGSVNFYPGNATQTMGVNGNLLGPTILLDRYQTVTMNVTNNLTDTTTIHWHGMHVAPQNDGGPHTVIPPGTTWSPSFPVLDWATTNWYHPHLHMKTNEHVQKGIAGMIIVRDDIEAAIDLPRTYGVDDIPLVIQTKAFDASNQIITLETALDTSLMINGTIDPVSNLPAQVVRLRLLNGSSERVYNIGFSSNQTFYQIGSDGGLLTAPVALTRLRIAPGERMEILVDFTGMQGQNTALMSYGSELPSAIYGASQPGMGAGQTIPNYTLNPLNGANFQLLGISIGAQTSNPITTIPSSLVAHSPWLQANASTTRTLTFSPQTMGPTAIQGPFLINMMPFDMMMINQYIPFENTEIWTLTNNTPIAHPFHIHDVQFYVLDINGVAPPANQQGRKDVILVPAGGGVVRFITKFEDFYNDTIPYMYHCHMLTHEDGGMMGQFIVNSPIVGLNESQTSMESSVYPNPVIDFITVDTPIGTRLVLYDNAGRLIWEETTDNENQKIDFSDLKTGVYFLNQVENEQTRVIKIFKN